MNRPFEGVETFVHTANKTAFVVAGMHRSGTSALTRVVSMLGAKLPRTLMPPQPDNPKGYWESSAVAQLNDDLLAELGSSWDDVLAILIRRDALAAQSQVIDRVAQVIAAEFSNADPIVLKEPRVGLLLDPWLVALTRQRYAPRIIIPIRNPLEVAASLSVRNGFSTGRSLLLWLTYFLAVDRSTRATPRVFVHYDDLLRDWRGVMRRIEEKFGCRFAHWSPAIELEVDAFLAQADRHHVAPAQLLEVRPDVAAWVTRAYDWARAATAGEERDTNELDAILTEYGAAARIFAPLVAEQRGEIATLSREVTRARSTLEGQATGITLRDQRIVELASELARRDERLMAREGELTRLQAEQAAAFARHAEEAASNATRISALEDAFAARELELAENAARLEARAAAAESRVVALNQDVAAYKRNIAQRDSQLQAKDAEIVEQRERVARLGAGLHDHESKIKTLEKELRDTTDTLSTKLRETEATHVHIERIEQISSALEALVGKVGVLESATTSAVQHAEENEARAEHAQAQSRAYRRFLESAMPFYRRWRRALWRRHTLRPLSYGVELIGLSLRRGPVAAFKALRTAARLRASEAFDTDYYLRTSWDVNASGRDPVVHYVVSGAAEGRNPSAIFSSAGYLAAYPDVGLAHLNPLEHFILHGRAEGRRAPVPPIVD